MKKLRELMKVLKIIQTVSNVERNKNGLARLGKGYFTAYRLNPLNPIGYLLVLLAIPFALVLFGIVGVVQKAENPFKWN